MMRGRGLGENPMLREGMHYIPRNQRPLGPPGVQRPRNPALVASMTRPNCPRRFVPPTPETRPQDLFHERKDFSINRFLRYFHKDDDYTMLAYTDGACLDQGGGADAARRRAGCAFVYCESKPGQKLPLEGTVGGPEQTSNRAELRAVLLYLQMRSWEAGGADRLVVATDSEYVEKGACEWIDGWVSNGWRTADGGPVLNRDLWEALYNEFTQAALSNLSILFWRIPRALNVRADALAKEAADMIDREESPSVAMGIMF